MLTFICWRWQPIPRYRSSFGPETVRVLRNMIARHYSKPHRFVCVTDRPKEIDKDIETMPLWSDYADLPSPHGGDNPSCYRRLKVFAREAGDLFGPRFVSIDLDTVIVADITPLFDRDEDFICWGDPSINKSWYNGSLFCLRAGARTKVWDDFDPKTSPRIAKRAGRNGSDQAWLSYCLGRGEATWGTHDGVYSFRVHLQPKGGALPANAKVVNFHGKQDPWSYPSQQIPWIQEHYR